MPFLCFVWLIPLGIVGIPALITHSVVIYKARLYKLSAFSALNKVIFHNSP